MTAAILLIYAMFSGMLILMLGGKAEAINPWLLALSQIFFLMLPAVLAVKLLKIDWKYIFRLNFPGMKFIILAAIGIFFIELFTQGIVILQEHLLPANLKVEYWKMMNEYMETIKQIIGGGDAATFFRSIIVVALVPAISEEMLFRGFLQTSLEYTTRITYAVIFSSFLFAAIHLNPVLFMPLFVAGLFFGYTSYLSSSIIVPVILHFLLNFAGIFEVFFVPDAGNISEDSFSFISGLILFVLGTAGITGISYLLYKMKRTIKTYPQSSSSDIV